MPALLLLAVLVQAPQQPAEPRELPFSWAIDLSVTGGLGALWLISEYGIKKPLAPPQCRWCATNGLDDAVRRAFVPAGTVTLNGVQGPDVASGVTGYVLTPLSVLGYEAFAAGSVKRWAQDVVIVLEAVMAALVANQVVKFAVGRERPFVSSLTPEQKAMTAMPADNNLSFFSGHATFTAAFAVAGGVVALQRGYRHPWVVFLAAGALSVTTSVLRIAADKHYFTDVLTGTLMGAAFGVAIPMLFHRPRDWPVEASVAPNGVALRVRF
jgi:membrane-associated phospholipid phosphatase